MEEDEDEYSEILLQSRADTLPNEKEPPSVPPHREPASNSLKTRSMDASYDRGKKLFQKILQNLLYYCSNTG